MSDARCRERRPHPSSMPTAAEIKKALGKRGSRCTGRERTWCTSPSACARTSSWTRRFPPRRRPDGVRVGFVVRAQRNDFPNDGETHLFERARRLGGPAVERGYREAGRGARGPRSRRRVSAPSTRGARSPSRSPCRDLDAAIAEARFALASRRPRRRPSTAHRWAGRTAALDRGESAQAGDARRLLGPGGPLAARLPRLRGARGPARHGRRRGARARGGPHPALRGGHRHGQDPRLPRAGHPERHGRSSSPPPPRPCRSRSSPRTCPLVAEHLGLDPRAALGKGLGNYLCLRRYEELRASAAALGDPSLRRSLPLVERWARDTETGDRAELVTLARGRSRLARGLLVERDAHRAGLHLLRGCFVTRMKRELEEARLVVVNHHLFFADVAVKMAAERARLRRARARCRPTTR